MRYCSKENRLDYTPPMLGNGAISIALDAEGTQAYDVRAHGPQRKIITEGRALWWAGRRFGYPATRPLIPFGHLTHILTMDGCPLPAPEEWEQSLDVHRALMRSTCHYPGAAMATEAFVHARHNVVAIEKQWDAPTAADYQLRYRLGASFGSEEMPRHFAVQSTVEPQGVRLRFEAEGQRLYRGVIRLMCDRPCRVRIDGNAYTLRVPMAKGERVHFYLILTDETDPGPDADDLAADILQEGYEAFRDGHINAWAQHYAQGGVQLPAETLQRVYDTAQYALKISATQWSIPTCLNDCCWDARFFAFDEFFNFHGLVTSGHFGLARRVTDFRFDGLEPAIRRASSRGMAQARYPWETVETHEEAAPPGFYYDHVFHMANVALGQWYYTLYTGDEEYLCHKAYPVMRACAEFFLRHMLYTVEGGRLIVGRCTDLERLGASVQNPFMTTCGVIVTLRNTAQAAARLGVDEALAQEYASAAERLLAALPQDGDRYLPAPGCAQRSIAVFAGCYPYPIFDEPNALLRRAFDDYIAHEQTFGNMYSVGQGVSTWYAAWKAVAFARLGDADACADALGQAASATGCFGEIFEINEPGVVQYRPWFTTSGGAYLTAVNEALLQCQGDTIHIARSIPPAWRTFAFDLPAWHARRVRLRVADGVLTECLITGPSPVQLRFPSWIACDILLRDGWIPCGNNTFLRS